MNQDLLEKLRTTKSVTLSGDDKKMWELIAKCWTDEGFKRKLLADPAATLKAEGVEVPAGLSIKVLENDDKLFHLIIPAKPRGAELSDEDLDMVAGGSPKDVGLGILLDHVNWNPSILDMIKDKTGKTL